MEMIADEALIRPVGEGPTVAEVTIIGPKELQIRARRGALQFSYRDETENFPEGASYRIVLDPPENSPAPFPQPVPPPPGPEDTKFKIILIASIVWTTEWPLHEVFETPDRP